MAQADTCHHSCSVSILSSGKRNAYGLSISPPFYSIEIGVILHRFSICVHIDLVGNFRASNDS